MMKTKAFILLITYVVFIISSSSTSDRTPILRIKNLNGLSVFTPEYNDIFKPQYISPNGKYHKHDIHVIDQFGKFLKLHYKAKHAANATILKMDEKLHKANIKSMVCKHDINNTIELQFAFDFIANRYIKEIEKTLADPVKKYFIVAGHEHGCQEKNGRYEHILREIVNIKQKSISDKTILVLDTKHAKLVDIFEKLDLEFSTNVGMHQHRVYNKLTSNNPSQRKLLWTWGDVWTFVTETIPSVVKTIKGVAEEIKNIVETIADVSGKIIAYALGEPVDIDKESKYTWNWNYDETTKRATDELSLTKDANLGAGVTATASINGCTNCFSYATLTISYGLHIDNYKIKTTKLVLEGETETNIEITGKITMKGEISIPIPDIPIPDLAFGVAGVQFGLFIGAQIQLGVILEVDTFAFEFNAYGKIKKGFEYNVEKGTQNYINEQEFHYKKEGPKLEFKSAKVTLYIIPTIYLKLAHVGNVYFGIQPRLELLFEKNEELSESCSLKFTPTLSLQPFIGVNIDTLGLTWNKDIQFDAIQPSISNWGGCIVQAKLTQIQTVENDVTYDETPNNRRRRLIGGFPDLETNAETFIDMSGIIDSEYKTLNGWGSLGTEWWANMSTIDEICDDWHKTCQGFNDTIFPIISPDNGTLLIHVINNSYLIGLYQTYISITPTDEWNIANVSIYTNISCLTRHELILDLNSDADMPIYNVERLEWLCDTDLNMIGINNSDINYKAWECMISLPQTITVMELDSSFGNIMLFDQSWCQVFSLTKKPQYQTNETQINNLSEQQFEDPSILWYGEWNCAENKSTHVEIFWINFNHTSGFVDAIMTFDTNESFYVNGNVSLNKERMILNVLYDYETGDTTWNLKFIGIINILYDGTITYSGTLIGTGCTGFIFQGYINIKQFETLNTSYISQIDTTNIGEEEESITKDESDGFGSAAAIAMFFIGFFVCLCIMIIILVVYVKYYSKSATSDTNNNDKGRTKDVNAGDQTIEMQTAES